MKKKKERSSKRNAVVSVKLVISAVTVVNLVIFLLLLIVLYNENKGKINSKQKQEHYCRDEATNKLIFVNDYKIVCDFAATTAFLLLSDIQLSAVDRLSITSSSDTSEDRVYRFTSSLVEIPTC